MGRACGTGLPTAASTCSTRMRRTSSGPCAAREVLTPLDLERTFNLTGGNIFQGAMSLNQLFVFRPVTGSRRLPHSNPRPVLVRLGCHPGGGVMGAAGANAARVILGSRVRTFRG